MLTHLASVFTSFFNGLTFMRLCLFLSSSVCRCLIQILFISEQFKPIKECHLFLVSFEQGY